MKNLTKKKLYGIPIAVINSIVSTILKSTNIDKIVLFGSRAKGNFKKGSDIDIALFSKNLSYDELIKIKANVGELMTYYSIDIVDFNGLKNDDLKDHILRVGKTLFLSKK